MTLNNANELGLSRRRVLGAGLAWGGLSLAGCATGLGAASGRSI